MTLTPTKEQTDILACATTTTENMLLVARAGSAKTTTLTMLAEALSPTACLCLAFNKKIAVELQTRLPTSASAQTLHSLGMQAWKGFIGKFPRIDDKKAYRLLTAEVQTLSGEDMSEAYELFSETLQIIRQAKSSGYVAKNSHSMAKPVMESESFYSSLEETPTDLQLHLADRVLRASFKEGVDGVIDFDDMVYLPAVMPVSFSHYPVVMVDEAQDLSILNHVLLKKIVKRNRLIAVGDPCQAIYSFRGADEDSMTGLKTLFSMRELYLTICFRSSEAVVRNARWRAPDMQWGPKPPAGVVKPLAYWGPADLRDGDAIICRNNAPLFRMALELLRNDMHPELFSGDIVASLTKVMKKLGKKTASAAEAMAALDEWKDKQLKVSRAPASVEDKADCIMLFLERSSTLEEAIRLLENITQRAGRIKLMTGHKSKGLEFHRVFFLDSFLIKKQGQDPNIKYVIETRPKNDLFYVKSEDFGKEAPVEAVVSQSE